jgi:sucrose-6F-phosphate phosphohydrolase
VEQVNLLISDLDGTLLGDQRALDEFKSWYVQKEDELRIVYSSGRFLESICESIELHGLPAPAGIICGVGTEIHDLMAGERVADWPSCRQTWSAEAVRAVCATIDSLEEQPRHLLSDFKVSYYGDDLTEIELARLERKLESLGQDVSIVYSSNRDLDILPAGTNKGTAARFLSERWSIGADRVIVAGDTGNDAGMFCCGFRGIVVGNARPELKSVRGTNVYHAKLHFAAGVLEGLKHWLGAPRAARVTADQAT